MGSEKYQQLKQMQALPLAEKEEASIRRIREWLAMFPEATVSFSGGKDSTVLLHLVRRINPWAMAVFSNTGLEFPEIVEFVGQHENVKIVKPEKNFIEIIRNYGYPVVGKRMAQYIGEAQRCPRDSATYRLRTTGINSAGEFSQLSRISKKWKFLIDAPFKISDKCCLYMKKKPLSKWKNSFIGVMAQDSNQREQTYYREGCNSPSAQRSWPMAFWLEEDVWAYIKKYNLSYCKVYDYGYERTGCMFCMFGMQEQGRPHNFDLMKKTHPKIYEWCINGPLKLGEIIRFTYGDLMLDEMPNFEKSLFDIGG